MGPPSHRKHSFRYITDPTYICVAFLIMFYRRAFTDPFGVDFPALPRLPQAGKHYVKIFVSKEAGRYDLQWRQKSLSIDSITIIM